MWRVKTMGRRYPHVWGLTALVLALVAQPIHASPTSSGLEDKAGLNPTVMARLDSAIEAAIAAGATPGAALAVVRHGQVVRLRGYGRTDWDPTSPPVTDSTLYDLASLTKVVGTTTAAMILVRQGRLALDRPIWHYLSWWPRTGRQGRITVRQLLRHTSGLPAGMEIWKGRGSRTARLHRLAHARVRYPPGTTRVYSDVGMILLGAVIEQVAGARLDEFLAREVFGPLAMTDTRFNPLHPRAGSPIHLARIAPTELDPRRGLVHGTVHDLNAAVLGGVAGHAGLFSSVRDLARFGEAVLDGIEGRPSLLAERISFTTMLKRGPRTGMPLGWDIPEGPHSAAGSYFPISSIGHTGFTGTSIWIDPEHDLFVVLLTNRIDPSAANQKHQELRQEVHDLVQLSIEDQIVGKRVDAQQ